MADIFYNPATRKVSELLGQANRLTDNIPVINSTVGYLTNGAGVLTYATGSAPMLMLGDFMFSINTAAYQEMNRVTEYRWATQERFAQHDALQYTGPGSDTITLPGLIYTEYRGGGGQIARLRAMAAKGQPQRLMDGTGNVLGRWVIESVEDKRSEFAALGLAKKIEFLIKLRHFDGGEFNKLVATQEVQRALDYIKSFFKL